MSAPVVVHAEIGRGGREAVDVAEAPWAAVGQVNNSVGGRCTGTLVAPNLALTAAHCLFSDRNGSFVRPQSVHFVLGYDRGAYTFHTTASDFHIGAGYDPKEPFETLSSDWAVLELAEPAPPELVPLAISGQRFAENRAFRSAGFARERSFVLTVTPPCILRTRRGDSGLASGRCDVPKGYSGGPLIDAADDTLIGIQVASGTGGDEPRVIAVLPENFLATVEALAQDAD